MENSENTTGDDTEKLEGYCPKLGHHIPFSYCLKPGQEQFCSSIRNCWFQRMNIDEYLRDHYSMEEIEAALAGGSSRMASILDGIKKSKNQP